MPSGPDLWNDEQYQQARGLLERPGKSPEFVATLQEAVKYYESKHGMGGAADGDGAPAPAPAQPPPAPAVTPPAPPKPAAPAAPQELPWYEALARGARDTAGMGFSDEFAGLGAKFGGDDVERRTGRSFDAPVDPNATAYRAERDAQRADDARALKESPTLYRTGEAIGLGGTAALPVSKLGRFAPAALGAANAAGASEAEATEHPVELARDTAVGGAAGEFGSQLLGPAVEAAAPVVSRKFGEWSGKSMDAANKHYLRASGARKPDLDRIVDRGDVNRLAEGGRRLGIGKGFIPKTVDAFGDDASLAVQKAADERAALEQAINAQGATVNAPALQGSVRGLQGGYARGPAGAPLQREIDRVATGMDAMVEPQIGPRPVTGGTIPWDQLNLERKTWGKTTNFQPGKPRNEIRQGVYGALNQSLEQGADAAIPGAGAKWRQAGEDQHVALELRDMASQRDNADTVNRLISPSDYGTGAAAYVASGDPSTAAAVAMANKVGRGREPAIREAFARNKSNLQGAASRGAAALGANPAPVAQAAARPAGAAASELGPMLGSAAHASSNPLDDFGTEPRKNEARGQMLPDAAMKLYQQQPEAFGKYAQQVFEARQQGEGQLSALLGRLQGDPEFARTVLPKLQAMTAEAR